MHITTAYVVPHDALYVLRSSSEVADTSIEVVVFNRLMLTLLKPQRSTSTKPISNFFSCAFYEESEHYTLKQH